MITQAIAFALVHLVHYGLVPFQPVLILFWLPSMFVVALIFRVDRTTKPLIVAGHVSSRWLQFRDDCSVVAFT